MDTEPNESLPIQIRGNSIRLTRLDADGQPLGPSTLAPLKRVTVEMTTAEVDPDLLALLTGQRSDGSRPTVTSMNIYGKKPWRWWQWQWWLRRPKREYHYYFPNVKIEVPDGT